MRLDAPAHWRSVVWALASWSVGAEVVDTGAPGADETLVVVTTDPTTTGPPPGGVPLVVMTLAALAFASADVPAGALDYNAVVAGFGDAMPLDGRPLERAVPVPVADDGDPVRELVRADRPDATATAAATAVLAALAGDGSVVLAGPGAPDLDHLAAVERVTTTAR